MALTEMPIERTNIMQNQKLGVCVKRKIVVEGEVARVPLTKGFVAIIDAADAPLVASWNWTARVRKGCVYACRVSNEAGRAVMILMHRQIAQPADGVMIDHRDGDGLNNRRSNLREASAADNNRNASLSKVNTSGFKGVSYRAASGKWRAQIKVDGRQTSLGDFQTKEEAALVYNVAASRQFGEFARLNAV